jgi:hypothetical protein
MQKVVGSSPIIRSKKAPGNGGFLLAWCRRRRTSASVSASNSRPAPTRPEKMWTCRAQTGCCCVAMPCLGPAGLPSVEGGRQGVLPLAQIANLRLHGDVGIRPATRALLALGAPAPTTPTSDVYTWPGRRADVSSAARKRRGLLGVEGFEFVRAPRSAERFGGEGSAAWSAPPLLHFRGPDALRPNARPPEDPRNHT